MFKMISFFRFISKSLRRKSDETIDVSRLPSVTWLLEHRKERLNKPALCKGLTPTASLYRMYEYLVTGYIAGLRTEIEFFFNQPSWAVSEIPDPQDPDPERYAILAGIPYYLMITFNRLIERGLPRNSPAIIAGPEMEARLRPQPVVLEEEPSWTSRVPKLEQILVIPDEDGQAPGDGARSDRFLEMNIVVAEPHVLFV